MSATLSQLAWIAIGGAAGSLLRFGVTLASARMLTTAFPAGTLIVNVAGSFLIGLLFAFTSRDRFAEPAISFVFVGLLGAFTTFSTYSLDALRLFQEGRGTAAGLYVLGNNVGALAAAAVGYAFGRFWAGSTG